MKNTLLFSTMLLFLFLIGCSSPLEEEVTSLRTTVEEYESQLKEKDDIISELEAGSSEELEKEISSLQSEISEKDEKINSLELQITKLQTYKEQVEAIELEQARESEARNNPVEITINNFSEDYGYYDVDGELKNITNSTLSSVTLRLIFTDNQGNIIDSEDTYVSTILPNGLTKYSAMVEYDERIENVNVQVIDFRFE